jgi:hypothetical protein
MMTTMAAPTMTTMAAPYAYGTAAPAYASYGYGEPTIAMESLAPQVTYAQAAPVAYAAPTMVETVAAPQVTYAAAAPQVTYAAAAPTVVETVAAAPQVTYAAAPTVVETVAAPQVTYAQAPITTQVASYVAQPQPQVTYAQAAMPQMVTAAQVPREPVKLTQGIPTPEQINQQKAGYSAALDKQLKEAIETVQKETAIEKEMIKFTADKTTALYNMQVDEKLIEALAAADEQSTFALLELNKAKVERNLQLNSQASGLVMDYQMKAVQTELAQKQYAFQQTYMSKENKLAEEYNKQVALANTGTTYAAY